MKRIFGNKLSTEEVLDATGQEWEMSSNPRDKKGRYKVKIGQFLGVGETLEDAAQKALRNAGLVKRERWPANRRRLEARPIWSLGLLPGHR